MDSRVYTPPTSFVDLLLDTVCVVDAEGRFVFVSAACERIFGYTQQEMIGTMMIEMVAPEDRERTLAAACEIMNGSPKPHFENRYLRKDGSTVHIMWSACWSDPDQLRIAVARDITERKRAEAMQAALYAISEAAHTARDLSALYPQIHRVVNELLPAPGFSIALYDAAHDHLDFPYNIDEFGQAAVSRAAVDGTLCGHVVRGGQALLVTPASLPGLPAALQDAARQEAPCWLGVPMASDNGVIGALVAICGPDTPCYTERDRELLQFVSVQIATAIERKQLHEQLQYMAQHDPLTRLPNRQLFHDRLESAIARARRSHNGFSLLYLDLDKFKPVNDLYGHETGDQLLQEVAARISLCVRDADTVARIGGDEFVVLLERAAVRGDAELVAEKIFAAILHPFDLGKHQLHIAPSLGIAVYPGDGDTSQRLLKHADDEMYHVKKGRVGRY